MFVSTLFHFSTFFKISWGEIANFLSNIMQPRRLKMRMMEIFKIVSFAERNWCKKCWYSRKPFKVCHVHHSIITSFVKSEQWSIKLWNTRNSSDLGDFSTKYCYFFTSLTSFLYQLSFDINCSVWLTFSSKILCKSPTVMQRFLIHMDT